MFFLVISPRFCAMGSTCAGDVSRDPSSTHCPAPSHRTTPFAALRCLLCASIARFCCFNTHIPVFSIFSHSALCRCFASTVYQEGQQEGGGCRGHPGREARRHPRHCQGDHRPDWLPRWCHPGTPLLSLASITRARSHVPSIHAL